MTTRTPAEWIALRVLKLLAVLVAGGLIWVGIVLFILFAVSLLADAIEFFA
jgi:hypothetical protein